MARPVGRTLVSRLQASRRPRAQALLLQIQASSARLTRNSIVIFLLGAVCHDVISLFRVYLCMLDARHAMRITKRSEDL